MSETNMISELVKALVAMQPPRKLGADEFIARTPFHPDGVIHTTLRRRTFQNGRQLDEAFLTERETHLLNLLPPGRYCDGLVTVKEHEQGTETDLHIMYRSGSQDDRIALASHYTGGLSGLLVRCIADAVAQGIAHPSVLEATRNDADPMKSMVLPTARERTVPAPPPAQSHPAIPGKGETPFEFPDTTGTSADEEADKDAEKDEGKKKPDAPTAHREPEKAPPARRTAPPSRLQASAIDLLQANP